MQSSNLQAITAFERIEITAFGGLKDVLITPTSGINVFTAPNESGKSTLAAFIKFIFYGFTGTRAQSVLENEKKKFLPWDMQHVAGAIVLKTPKGRYRIERTFALPSRDNVIVIDTASGKQVFAGLCPGEQFFGVGEEVFAKSIFFGQLSVPQSGDDSLAEQLRNLIFSADEQTSLTKAYKRIKDARNALVSRTNGRIPALKQEYESLCVEFSKAETQNSQIFFAQKQLNRVTADVAEKSSMLEVVAAEKENFENYEIKQRLEGYRKKEQEMADLSEQLELSKAEFPDGIIPDRQQISTLEDDAQSLVTAEQLLHDRQSQLEAQNDEYERICEDNPIVATDEDSAQVAEKYSKAKSLPITTFIATVLSGAASGTAYAFHEKIGSFAPYIVYSLMGIAGVFGILFVLSLIKFLRFGLKYDLFGIGETKTAVTEYPTLEARSKTLKRDIAETEKRTEEIKQQVLMLRKRVGDLFIELSGKQITQSEMMSEIKDLATKASDARTKQMLYDQAASTLETLYKSTDMQKQTERAAKAKEPQRAQEDIEKEYKFLTASLNSLQAREKEASIELAACSAKAKNPAELAGKRDAVKRVLDELEKKAVALEAAMDMLEVASEYMRSTISPKLTQYASELFEDASLGRYRTLEIDNSLNMTFSSRIYTKSSDFMSAGTRDSAYLSLRLALAKLLFRDIIPPLVLDDAFGKLDDNRLSAMLGIIAAYGSQVFVFTCQDREREILKSLKIECSELSLEKKDEILA